MCGLAGFWQAGNIAPESTVIRMAECLAHRGPDDSGVWVDPQSGVALAHRRLSVLDLSSAGRQPMVSQSGRYVIVYNGEVYNHLDLRQQLDPMIADKRSWRGHSDTETILACVESWGIERTLRRSEGMFAFALWDRQDRTLMLARDRFGEKPLYYGIQNDVLLFASELKALRQHPAFDGYVDRNAVASFVRYGFVAGPQSIYSNIFRLEPGCWIQFPVGLGLEGVRRARPEAYWSLIETVRAGISHPFQGTDDEAAEELDRLLRAAVSRQMLADVPLGAFLSGGVDSSLVVAAMQQCTSRPVKTFTVGFREKAFDEASYARKVAEILGTDHTEFAVGPTDVLDAVTRLPEIWTEPFADVSQVPTYLISRAARTSVTVALTGDAGDELFCGYTRHFAGPALQARMSRIPGYMRRAASGLLLACPERNWDRLYDLITPLIPRHLRSTMAGQKLLKLARAMSHSSPGAFYQALVSRDMHPESTMRGATPSPWSPRLQVDEFGSLSEWMSAMDTLGYLPDDILTKVDRASMSVGLETRVPMLDPSIVRFSWSLPLHLKVRDGSGKWLPKRLLSKYLPTSVYERPKHGFELPIGHWLRGPLRDWAQALLNARELASDGWFDSAAVSAMWNSHLAGRGDYQHRLWSILMFQAWLRSTGDK